MENNKQKLRDQFSMEIEDINYILKNLYEERIYYPGKFTNAKSDGTLQENINQLRKKLNDLFYKIENDKPSDMEKLNELFK